MSTEKPQPGLEEVLTNLEQVIAKLADGTAPLEELVVAHQRAVQLLAEAGSRLDELKTRAAELTAVLGE